MSDKKIEKCAICNKPSWRSFNCGEGYTLHTCKKHYSIVSTSAIVTARLLARNI